MVVDILPLRKDMAIVTIADIMATLNVNASKDKMIHKKVQAMEDCSFHTFINEVVNMVVLVDRIEVVICLPCNKY